MLLLNERTAVIEADELHLDDDCNHERRRGLRVRDQRPVKIFEPGAGRYYGGQTEDISVTGLRIELPAWTSLRTGQMLTIHVGLNRKGSTLANRRSMIPARVVWISRPAGNTPTLEAGVEFLNSIGTVVYAA